MVRRGKVVFLAAATITMRVALPCQPVRRRRGGLAAALRPTGRRMRSDVMKAKLLGAAALALLVAACGTESNERVTGGAAAGAATGAGVGALGGPVGAAGGALVGGGAGAVTGAMTDPSDLNLGSPPWNNPEVRTPDVRRGGASTASSDRSTRRRDGSASRRSMDDRDRAYMGGGMVVEPGSRMDGSRSGSSMSGSSTSGSSGMQGGGRVGDEPRMGPTGRGTTSATGGVGMGGQGATLEQNPDRGHDSGGSGGR
jgi:hypothetical protein